LIHENGDGHRAESTRRRLRRPPQESDGARTIPAARAASDARSNVHAASVPSESYRLTNLDGPCGCGEPSCERRLAHAARSRGSAAPPHCSDPRPPQRWKSATASSVARPRGGHPAIGVPPYETRVKPQGSGAIHNRALAVAGVVLRHAPHRPEVGRAWASEIARERSSTARRVAPDSPCVGAVRQATALVGLSSTARVNARNASR